MNEFGFMNTMTFLDSIRYRANGRGEYLRHQLLKCGEEHVYHLGSEEQTYHYVRKYYTIRNVVKMEGSSCFTPY